MPQEISSCRIAGESNSRIRNGILMQASKKDALQSLVIIALFAVVASGETVVGQSGNNMPRAPMALVNNSWPEVNLNVVVIDKRDAPQKIDEQTFQLFEDGSERPLQLRG